MYFDPAGNAVRIGCATSEAKIITIIFNNSYTAKVQGVHHCSCCKIREVENKTRRNKMHTCVLFLHPLHS